MGSVVLSGWYDRNGDGQLNRDIDSDNDGNLETSSEAGYVSGVSSVAVGTGVQATADRASSFGVGSTASGVQSTAIGFNASATAENALALGNGAVADQANTISVGAVGAEKRIVNVAAGTAGTDAVNVNQLTQVAGYLGAGASASAAPTYTIQGANYSDVGSALGAVNNSLSALFLAAGANNGGVPANNPLAVNYTDDTYNQVALQGANGTQVSNVAPAQAGTDAVNLNQLQTTNAATLQSANSYTDTQVTANNTTLRQEIATGDATTLQAANTYTDTQVTANNTTLRQEMATGNAATLQSANTYTNTQVTTNNTTIRQEISSSNTATLNSAKAYTDNRVSGIESSVKQLRSDVTGMINQQNRLIDQQGAMSAAMLNMASSAGAVRTANRVALGIGTQNGEQAISVGYQRSVNDRTAFTLGGAATKDQSSFGIGLGFGW